VSDELRERVVEVISEHAIDFQGVPPDYDGDAVAYIADRILALLSAPEPAELDEVGVEEAAIALMEMVGGPGVPDHFAARTAIEAYLRVANAPAPTAAEPEREAPTPEKLRAMADWFDDPKNPLVATHLLGGSLGTASYLLRRFATAITLATPEAKGGSP
jgi:hypothetical protein